MTPPTEALLPRVTRRGFIIAGGAVLGAATLGWDGSVRAAGMSELRRADFDAATGTPGKLRLADGQDLPVVLSGTRDVPGALDPQASFAALFTATAAGPLQQGTFAFTHADLGRHHLFLVPGAPGPRQVTYEAIFNRPDPLGAQG